MDEAEGNKDSEPAKIKTVEAQDPFLIIRSSSKEAALFENDFYKNDERKTERKISTDALEDEAGIRNTRLKEDVSKKDSKESVLLPPAPLQEESTSLREACSVLESGSGVGRSESDGGWGRDFCRICHEAEAAEGLISPCRCRGSLSVVHRSCLERWLAEADSSSCELCGYLYATERFPRYGVMASVWAWLRSGESGRERRELAFDLVALVAFTPLVTLGTYLGCLMTETLFTGRTDERQTASDLPGRMALMSVISMMTTLDLAYASWIFLRLQYHCAHWYSWYRRNSKVKLLPPSSEQSNATDG